MRCVNRFITPTALNALVPGTGLVVLGRTWLGLLVALGFTLAAELAIIGLLVAPAGVPPLISWGALVAAAVFWTVGQALLAGRVRLLRSDGLPRELAILRRLARRAMGRGDFTGAAAAISVALSLDDSDPATHVQRARLLSITSTESKARKAWTMADRLDNHQEHAEEIRDRLKTPPSE